MAISVVMPALEMAQENGKLLAWRKKEGESVTKGEALLEIETDKAVVEVEAPGDGILAGITADVGAVVPVGQTIAWLVAPGEKPPAMAATAAPAARASSSPGRTAAATAPAAAQHVGPAAQISPKARRLAKELGVDIARIRGTGPDGTITSEDVQRAADAKNASVAAPAGVEVLSQVARLMAERTTQSWTTVPHFFLVREVDGGALVAARKKWSVQAEKTQSAAPTITGRLLPADITGGTFTLSNLGMYKVDAFSAIIAPPQAAILAVGSISDRVVALDGKPEVRPMMTMTLSSDHRVVDGARAAEFLSELADAIREPEKVL
jgi:pyruvate dehydrogenase E2 component (dihydrolipoamide acetyltransferase)